MTWLRALTFLSSPFLLLMISLKSINLVRTGINLTYDLFLLIADDLLMLISHQLLFLFEVLNYLSKRLLKYLDLSLESLDLLLLGFAALIILVNSTKLKHVCSLGLLIFLLKLQLFALTVIQGVALCNRLLGQLLILQMDVLFNVKDV